MSMELITKALEEHGDAVTGLSSTVEELKAQTQKLEENVTDLTQANREIPGDPGVQSTGLDADTKSYGHQVVKSSEFKAFAEGRSKSAVIPVDLDLKNTLVSGSGVAGTTQINIQASRSRDVGEDLRREISLLNQLPTMAISVNTFEFHRLAPFTNAADYQLLQGDTKPQQDLSLPLQSVNVSTIAVTIPVSKQLMDDSPALMMFLNSKLRFGLVDRLEAEVIAGGGGGEISGLETESTAFTPTATAAADRVAEALTQLEILGWTPSHVLLNPTDWNNIRSERASGSGEYVVSDWASDAAPRMWGTPVVTSNSVTAGQAMVIDSGQLLLLNRQNASVETGYVSGQFRDNLVTIRAELRAGLAVYSPSAIQRFALS
ncbi:MAG: phage major capsid protein [Pseudomonadota bacterium]